MDLVTYAKIAKNDAGLDRVGISKAMISINRIAAAKIDVKPGDRISLLYDNDEKKANNGIVKSFYIKLGNPANIKESYVTSNNGANDTTGQIRVTCSGFIKLIGQRNPKIKYYNNTVFVYNGEKMLKVDLTKEAE